ncbi:protein kinase family protein [Prescottella equi]|uniref:protein kinase family protein n=1 Tax=Rhodococcus hoagii TaxID=43767 RepID=UPI001F5BBD3C|nr:protein kinase family protein [Prescottella equi]UNQ33889.1 protein kinase family protein [Prescottella equi]
MTSAAQRPLERFLRRYKDELIDTDYLELYFGHRDPSLCGDLLKRGFASIHCRLDSEFDWMNYKARNGQPGHFNADNSRSLLDLIDEIRELNTALERAGQSLTLSPEYERVLNGSKGWLVPSGGSPIPDGFTPVFIEKYDPVFGLSDAALELADHSKVNLTVVGEGAYAIVHKFVDPNYDLTIARKKLKRGADERDVERFRREYEIMKGLDFPYILKVYRYNEAENSYTMEFCESTLEQYIKRRNNQPSLNFDFRRRIALQFLFGLNYLHRSGICHRDLSLKNVLLHEYDSRAVTVKLSDFGLAKPRDSEFTRVETEIRGTIVDPTLDKFKEFGPVNDIYVVGFVLSYVFKGVQQLLPGSDPLGEIIQKCSHSDPKQRYQTVLEIIAAVETLEIKPEGTPA